MKKRESFCIRRAGVFALGFAILAGCNQEQAGEQSSPFSLNKLQKVFVEPTKESIIVAADAPRLATAERIPVSQLYGGNKYRFDIEQTDINNCENYNNSKNKFSQDGVDDFNQLEYAFAWSSPDYIPAAIAAEFSYLSTLRNSCQVEAYMDKTNDTVSLTSLQQDGEKTYQISNDSESGYTKATFAANEHNGIPVQELHFEKFISPLPNLEQNLTEDINDSKILEFSKSYQSTLTDDRVSGDIQISVNHYIRFIPTFFYGNTLFRSGTAIKNAKNLAMQQKFTLVGSYFTDKKENPINVVAFFSSYKYDSNCAPLSSDYSRYHLSADDTNYLECNDDEGTPNGILYADIPTHTTVTFVVVDKETGAYVYRHNQQVTETSGFFKPHIPLYDSSLTNHCPANTSFYDKDGQELECGKDESIEHIKTRTEFAQAYNVFREVLQDYARNDKLPATVKKASEVLGNFDSTSKADTSSLVPTTFYRKAEEEITNNSSAKAVLTLTSTATDVHHPFRTHGKIHSNYAGENGISPPLAWTLTKNDEGITVKRYAVIMDDGETAQWNVFDISSNETNLEAGASKTKYTSPNPEAGETRNYTIHVYALDTSFDSSNIQSSVSVTSNEFEYRFYDHIIAKGTISGEYSSAIPTVTKISISTDGINDGNNSIAKIGNKVKTRFLLSNPVDGWQHGNTPTVVIAGQNATFIPIPNSNGRLWDASITASASSTQGLVRVTVSGYTSDGHSAETFDATVDSYGRTVEIQTTLATPVVRGYVANAQSKSVDISWDAVPQATSYEIQYSKDYELSEKNGKQIKILRGQITTVTTETNSITIESLDIARYYYRVRALSLANLESGRTDVKEFILPLPAPTNIQITTRDQEVNLSWDAVSGGAIGYTVSYRQDTETSWTSLPSQPEVRATVDGLINGRTYYFQITSTHADFSADLHGRSKEQEKHLPLLPPQNFSATADDTQVFLAWEAASGATGYIVYWKEKSSSSYDNSQDVGNALKTTIGSLTNDTAYDFAIEARDEDETSVFATDTATPRAAATPQPPTNLQARALDGSRVELTWNKSLSPSVSYTVYWATSQITDTTGVDGKSNVQSPHTVTGLTGNTTYYFRVRADKTNADSSGLSNEATSHTFDDCKLELDRIQNEDYSLDINLDATSVQCRYISNDGANGNNGNSWQTALPKAELEKIGKTIDGTVNGNTGYPDASADNVYLYLVKAGNYTGSFSLREYVVISGGYSGNGYNLTSDATVFDGENNQQVFVNQDIAQDSKALLNRVTVTNGHTQLRREGGTEIGGTGGGISNTQASPAFSLVHVTKNYASSNGGGVYNKNSSPVFSRVTLEENTSDTGGGLYSSGGDNNNTTTFIASSVIRNSAEAGNGGGIVANGTSLTLVNVTVANNTASNNGGGIVTARSISGTVTNHLHQIFSGVTISGNTASNQGGGVYNDVGGRAVYIAATIANNSANQGAGIYNKAPATAGQRNLVLANTILWGNSLTGDNGKGSQILASSTNSTQPGEVYFAAVVLQDGQSTGFVQEENATSDGDFTTDSPNINDLSDDGDAWEGVTLLSHSVNAGSNVVNSGLPIKRDGTDFWFNVGSEREDYWLGMDSFLTLVKSQGSTQPSSVTPSANAQTVTDSRGFAPYAYPDIGGYELQTDAHQLGSGSSATGNGGSGSGSSN